jgi:spore coat protein U-like protein
VSVLRRCVLSGLLVVATSVAGAAQCSLTAVGVAFGSYDVFSTQDTDVAGTITVSCQSASTYSISLSPGSGSLLARRLTNGSNLLAYNLFTDPQRLTIWGDGSQGTVTVNGSGTGASYTVYGRIPAAQNVYVGSYSDTIVVTVTY